MRDRTRARIRRLTERLDDPDSPLSEDYSIAALHKAAQVYQTIENAHFSVQTAINKVEGVPTSSISADAVPEFENAAKHLKKARQEVHNAMRAIQPDIEGWGFWNDMAGGTVS